MSFERDYLTPHFQRWEFTSSETAARRGIDNSPNLDQWLNLKSLSEACLEPARAALGPLRITSGYRCPALNALIGGALKSQHLDGEAADVIGYEATLPDLFKWLAKHVEYDQLIWEFSQWVHVSHKRNGPQRHQALLAEKVNGKTVYAPISDEHMMNL